MAWDVNIAGISRTRYIGTPSVAIVVQNDFLKRIYGQDLTNIFFNSNHFAESVQYTHVSFGRVATYKGLYDDPHSSRNFGAGADYDGIVPQVQLIESALSFPVRKNDLLTIRGQRFIVESEEPDGVGVTTLRLRFK